MPTEHEYKYVLQIESENVFKGDLKDPHIIEQGYLAFSKGMSTRIRSIQKHGVGDKQWYFTFKQKAANRVIEIEQKISERDGEDLWPQCIGKLWKHRYVCKVPCNKHIEQKWELDFFYDKHNKCYFSLAEIELPEGAPRPSPLPKFLREFVIHEVCLTDDRFSNKRLGDVRYANELYQSLFKGVNYENQGKA